MQISKSVFIYPLAVFAIHLTACQGSDSPVDHGNTPKEQRLTEEQRQALVPNALFVAVYNGDLAKTESVARNSPELLKSFNTEFGETPLAMALRLEMEKIAEVLLPLTPDDELTLVNARKESYVFLAARAGYAKIIREIGSRGYENSIRYNFNNWDLTDELGRKALFVARDRNIAKALQDQYYRGVLKYPWKSFFQVVDQKNRSFLHWAAAENRRDVIAWAVEAICKNDPAPGDGFFKSALRVINEGHNRLRFWTDGTEGWVALPGDLYLNRKDDEGRTALHYAAESLSLEAIHSLQSCHLTNPITKDKGGNTYLHVYLAALDKRAPALNEAQVNGLAPMVNYENKMQAWWNRRNYMILDEVNLEGRTPAHVAATLNDPRPFAILQSIRNISTVDRTGLTPERLRERILLERREAPRK